MNNDGQKNSFQRVRIVLDIARVNARAYAAVVKTVFRERLWRVPAPRGSRAEGSTL
ncbi:MAG TPA: hypothetical protein VHM31_06265 [Polyangia bacterium]|nr:hypothetical protein [Polyangia bacterium]